MERHPNIQMGDAPPADAGWTSSRWLTQGDHSVDLTRWLFGSEFTEVQADTRALRYPQYAVKDYGVAHFLLDHGATAPIHSNAIAPAGRVPLAEAPAAWG